MKRIILLCCFVVVIFSGCMRPSKVRTVAYEHVEQEYMPESIQVEEKKDIKDAEYGDYIEFGTNPNGTPMEWMVLSRYEDKVFVVSRNCVTYMMFGKNSCYATSNIKRWLAGEFMNRFTEDEMNRIGEKLLSEWEVGEEINVKAFLLSQHEVNVYFEEGDAAEENGKIWWTRTYNSKYIERVYAVNSQGGTEASAMSTETSIGVRPAMYIYFESVAERD